MLLFWYVQNGSWSPDTGHISSILHLDETQLNTGVIMAMESDEEDDDNLLVRLSALHAYNVVRYDLCL